MPRILGYMAVGNEPRAPAIGHPAWASLARSGLLGFAVQAVVALVTWLLIDDSAGRGWLNRDFLEWVTYSIVLTVLLAALAGAVTRRWRTTLAVALGCLLAIALGCTIFIAHAVANSV